jgi:hypothetical protein
MNEVIDRLAFLEGELKRLNDEAEIQRLLVRYCTLVDSRDAHAVATEIFAEEAVDDHGIDGRAAVGRPAIESMFTKSNESTESSAHFVTNSVVVLNSDTARAQTYVTGWTWLRKSSDLGKIRPADFAITAIYDDELRRYPDGWKIVHRKLQPLGPGAVGYGVLPPVYYGTAGVQLEI